MTLQREAMECPSAMKQMIPQALAISVNGVLMIVFGMTMSYPTFLIDGVADPKENLHIGIEGLSWIGSTMVICMPVGALISGKISQMIGRRRTIQIINIPYIIAWMMFFFCNAPWQIFFGLVIFGLCGGLMQAPIMAYAAEIAQPRLRGILCSVTMAFMMVGVLFILTLTIFIDWRKVALVACCLNAASFIFLLFMPESPHWYIQKLRYDEATASLAWLRGWTTKEVVEQEFGEILDETKEGLVEVNSWSDRLKPLVKRSFVRPFGLIAFMSFVVHFGMTPLITFELQLYDILDIPIYKFHMSALMGASQLMGSILHSLLVHNFGKRLLTFTSLIVMAGCLALLGAYTHINGYLSLNLPDAASSTTATTPVNNEVYGWAALILFFLYACFAQIGVRTTCLTVMGEVFPGEMRTSALGICTAMSCIIAFLANKSFYSTIKFLTVPGTFWFYGCVALLGLVVLFFIMPETEGRSLGDILKHFAGERKLGNKVLKEKTTSKSVDMGCKNDGYIKE